jgi:hypothetical protein
VIGGIASVTSLSVSGISTLGIVTSGDIFSTGVITATSFTGSLSGTATTANNLSDAANITTGTINSARLSGFYSINVSYANTAGIATVAQGLTGTPSISVSNLNVSGISTLGIVTSGDIFSTGVITATSFVGSGSGLTQLSASSIVGTVSTATNVIGGIASATSLSVSGISTLGTVQISSGIITATSGVVTYYGDGSKLQGINASGAISISNNITNSNQLIPYTISFGSTTGLGASNNFVFNPSTGNLGIGTTNPTSQLYVVGDTYITGILTANRIVSSVYGEFTGGSISGSNIVGTSLSISGISTLGIVTSGDIFSTGVITATSFTGSLSGTATTANNLSDAANITTGTINSARLSGFYGINVSYANTAGIATVAQGLTGTPSISITNLNVSGVSTLGTVQISSGIITATAGVVTYYGDGSKLSSVVANINVVNDTTTNATRYITFEDVTSGQSSSVGVSSTKLTFNPSTGTLSATVFTSLSDKSQKTNIEPIQNPIEITKQLTGVKFKWKDNHINSLGLIAQDVEKVLPEVVNTDENGIKSVNYGSLIGLLVETIKEQQIRIEILEEKLNA